VLGAVLLLFALMALVPGDPATALLGPQATPEYAAAFVRQMGLDQPWPIRLTRFLASLARGDLGLDVITGRPVASLVGAALPPTLVLALASIGAAVLVGVPLGCYAATHRGSALDHALAAVSVALVAVPSFVLAILLLIVFSLWLDWLPVLGTGRDQSLADAARRLVLPAAALALGWVGFIARLVRSSMLEALAQGHIRTARAFGLPERRIVYLYALKNACLPVVAVLGLGVGRLLGGAVLVEIVFARPGLGRLIYDAVAARNYPVLQGAVLVVVLLFVLTNLAVDLLLARLDPRIGAGESLEAG
jgi:peptide/nickel transport system permease protein